MLVIWQGWGLLIPVLLLLGLMVTQLVFDHYLGEGFYSSHRYAQGVGLFVGGVLVTVAGRLLRGTKRLITDVDTGEYYEIKSKNSLFWLPFEFWGLATIGVAVLVLASVGRP
jgi:hypothetical protein